jgi:hypothetical protein
MRRIAFFAITMLSAAGVAHCSSSPKTPGLASNSSSSGGSSGGTSGSGSSSGSSSGGVSNSGLTVSIGDQTSDGTSTLDWDAGLTPCGTTTKATASVTLTNTSTSSIAWTAKFLSGGTYYQLGQTSGTVPSGSSNTLQIIPNMIPATASVAADSFQGTVQISSGTNGSTQTIINLHQTAQGAILTTSINGSTTGVTAIPFGAVAEDQTAVMDFTITNAGNVPVTGLALSDSSSKPFPLGGADGGLSGNNVNVNVPAGGTLLQSVGFIPPGTASYADTLQITLPPNTPLCGAAPASTIALSGNGTTGIVVSPTTPLGFGTVSCGSPPPNGHAVTITNKGGDCNWSGAFGTAYYHMEFPDGGQIPASTPTDLPAGSSVIFNVVPNQLVPPVSVAANALGDTLTITTTSPGDTAHNVQLQETAQGAFIQVSGAVTATPGGLGLSTLQPLTIQNTGTLPAYLYTTTTITQGNDSSQTYPFNVEQCASYTNSTPFPNECAFPLQCSDWNASPNPSCFSIVPPEFCTNLAYTQTSAVTLYPNQTLGNPQPELQSTGYPTLGIAQAEGYITVVPCSTPGQCTFADGGPALTTLCSEPTATITLQAPSYGWGTERDSGVPCSVAVP